MRRVSGLIIVMLASSLNTARAASAEVQVVCASGHKGAAAANLNSEIVRVSQNQDVTLSAPSVAVNSNGGETTVCVTVTLAGSSR